MTDEKILDGEVMNEEELEGIAGGTRSQTMEVANFLTNLGLMQPIASDERASFKVNQVLKHFNFYLIEDQRGDNIVKHQNRHGQLRNSDIKLLYNHISEKVAEPGFDFTPFRQ